MPVTDVRVEPQRTPSEIIRAALRDAAIAPTIYDALDVAGDALRRVLELVSEGGHHAKA